jgi:hypothetical protein
LAAVYIPDSMLMVISILSLGFTLPIGTSKKEGAGPSDPAPLKFKPIVVSATS